MKGALPYRKHLQSIGIITLLAALATLLGQLFVRLGITETNIVVIYIFAVLLISRLTPGYLYGILSSGVCILCYNYFFTVPYYTLKVNDLSYLVTFAIMMIISSLTSAITTKEMSLTLEARQKGQENMSLYLLSSALAADAVEIHDAVSISARSISEMLGCDVRVTYISKKGDYVCIQQHGREQIHRSIDQVEELQQRLAHLKSEYDKDRAGYHFPISNKTRLYGFVTVDGSMKEDSLRRKARLLMSMNDNILLSIERIEANNERIQDRQNMEKERERATLLRAISHDLRTPLSGIMGTAEMLMDMTAKEDDRQPLLLGIYQDADWLKSLVENILNLTRLQDGKILIHKELEALEEVIGCAVAHVEKQFPDREILVTMAEDFRLVPMDAKLMESVITNLLNNAIKHTTREETIEVSYMFTDTEAVVTVRDEGTGIAPEDLPNLFEMFYTSKKYQVDVKKGVGLGLTICQIVVNAHGGTIMAQNRLDQQGAEFIFTLPLQEGSLQGEHMLS